MPWKCSVTTLRSLFLLSISYFLVQVFILPHFLTPHTSEIAPRLVSLDDLYPNTVHWRPEWGKEIHVDEVSLETIKRDDQYILDHGPVQWPKVETSNDQDPLGIFETNFSSPENTLRISIHVFAWRRSKSLQRLCTSLLGAYYAGVEGITLIFHVDGNATEEVLEIVDRFVWPYGEKVVEKKEIRVGLRKMMLTSWHPTHDSEYALFLEDDIEVSALFFEYILWCIRTFFTHPDPHLMGCSLYTPRLDEISPTSDPQHPPRWTPTETLGEDVPVFLFQLPCSWGAVYRGGHWKRFVKYYGMRLEGEETERAFPPIPNARSNMWKKSWKRFLIEFMYIFSLYLLYPSFSSERSFSTNYYETGVHTVSEDHPESSLSMLVPDWFRAVYDERFTVPLLRGNESDEVWARLGGVERKNEMKVPLVGLSHRVVEKEEIRRLGMEFSEKEVKKVDNVMYEWIEATRREEDW